MRLWTTGSPQGEVYAANLAHSPGSRLSLFRKPERKEIAARRDGDELPVADAECHGRGFEVAPHIEMPEVCACFRIHSDQVAVVVSSEDESPRRGKGARPHFGGTGHGKFKLDLAGQRAQSAEYEVPGLCRWNRMARPSKATVGRGLLRGAVVVFAFFERYHVKQ